MKRAMTTSTAFIYKYGIKPILFTMKPDSVHSLALRAGSVAQKAPFILRLLSWSYAYKDDPILAQTLHGITFKNPIGLSAGFDKNIEIPLAIHAMGFGFMEAGTITEKAYGGNPRPWFHRLPHSQSLVVHAGLANQGIRSALGQLDSYPDTTFKNFPLSLSVAQTNEQRTTSEAEMIESYRNTLLEIKKSGYAHLITLNISCPNTFNGEPFTSPAPLDRLLTMVMSLKLKQPIFLKMPCDLRRAEYKALLDVAVKHHTAGVILANLTKDRSRISPNDTLAPSVKGGLSGKLMADKTTSLIKETFRHYGNRLTIVGVGGIFTAADAYEKIKAGAHLVELITGMIFKGPQMIGVLNAELAELLRADGFSSMSEAVGSDVAKKRHEAIN